MFGLGITEIIVIVIVVFILFSGGDKLAEVARGLGKFTGEFQKGKAELEKEIELTRSKSETPTQPPVEPPR